MGLGVTVGNPGGNQNQPPPLPPCITGGTYGPVGVPDTMDPCQCPPGIAGPGGGGSGGGTGIGSQGATGIQGVTGIQGITGIDGGVVAPNQPTFAQGQLRPAAAGTAEQLTSQAVPNGFTIFGRAFMENDSDVYIGKSKANAEDPTVGSPVEPGAFFELALTNTDEIWVNVLTTGDGVFWYVEAAS